VYRPEVNPAEHIWEGLREKTLPHMTSRSLAGLVNEWCAGIEELAADTERVRSMTDSPCIRIPL
jgi:hypothetical protein